MLEALPAAQSAGQKAQEDAQLGQGSIFDFGDDAGGRRRAPPQAHAPAADLGRRVRPRRAAGDGEGDARHLPLLAPAGRSRATALRARVDCSLAELGEQAGRRLGDGRRDRRRLQEDPHQERQPDDVRDPRRRRGPGRDAGLQGRPGRERRGDRSPTRSSSSAAGSTTRTAARPSWSCRRRERFEPDAAEIAAAAKLAATRPAARFEVPIDAGRLDARAWSRN